MISIKSIEVEIQFMQMPTDTELGKCIGHMRKNCDEIGVDTIQVDIDEDACVMCLCMSIASEEKFGGQYRAVKFVSRHIKKYIHSDCHGL